MSLRFARSFSVVDSILARIDRFGWLGGRFHNWHTLSHLRPIIGYSIQVNHCFQMNTKQQLLKSIQETEEQLVKLKEQLNKKTPTIKDAEVGDVLEDGSIVLKKENGLALVVAPKSTEVHCKWSKEFSEVYDKLYSEGFTPSQWFIPSVEQLKLAYKEIPDEFNKKCYLSSSESNASSACFVDFLNGVHCNYSIRNTSSIRAFRCISY